MLVLTWLLVVQLHLAIFLLLRVSTAMGSWSFELQVTDNAEAQVTSSATSVTVNAAPSVTISPITATLVVGQSQLFTAVPNGGSGSYTSYQWYVDGSGKIGDLHQHLVSFLLPQVPTRSPQQLPTVQAQHQLNLRTL